MHVTNLKLVNFRNHKNLNLDFHSRLVFFIGNNGEGKTNILEALHLFSTLKSFRDNSDDEMLSWNENHFYIKCDFIKEDLNRTLEYGYQKVGSKKRKLKLNSEEIHRKIDLIGEFKSVIFSPDDLRIIDDGPSERRRFIDSFISTIDKSYYTNILNYNKILKQRNTLLKNKDVQFKQLIPWNQMLIEKGIEIQKTRTKIINEMNLIFCAYIMKLSNQKDEFTLIYKPNIKDVNEYSKKIETSLKNDLRLGYTTNGIHRDDLLIGKLDKDITEFGSQGQKRSAVISLKTTAFKYIQTNLNETPVLLIDDIIRELDIYRREIFVDLLSECGQVFFTSTDLDGLDKSINSLKEQSEIFHLKSESIAKK